MDFEGSEAIPVSQENGKLSEIHLGTNEDYLDSLSATPKSKQIKGIALKKGEDSQSVSDSSATYNPSIVFLCNEIDPRKEVVENGSVADEGAVSVAGPSRINSQPLTRRKGKSYVCDVCGKSFRTPCQRDKHYRTHTGEKPFVCDICERKFTLEENLNVHLRTHTGEKLFKCRICYKRFSQNGNCKRHIRTHLRKKHFVCHICNKGFTRKSRLQIHFQTHAESMAQDKYKLSEFDNGRIDGCLDSASERLKNERRKRNTVVEKKRKYSQSVSASSANHSPTIIFLRNEIESRKEVVESYQGFQESSHSLFQVPSESASCVMSVEKMLELLLG